MEGQTTRKLDRQTKTIFQTTRQQDNYFNRKLNIRKTGKFTKTTRKSRKIESQTTNNQKLDNQTIIHSGNMTAKQNEDLTTIN